MTQPFSTIVLFTFLAIICIADSEAATNYLDPDGVQNQTNSIRSHYRVLTFPTNNFLNVYSNSTGTFYAGFFVDILERIAEISGFTYTLTISDTSYGTHQPDGTFDGLIGELIAGRTDIIGPDLVPTPEREAAVDFTAPYYQGKLQLLVRRDADLDNLNYVILNSAATIEFFSGSRQPFDQAIWSNIQSNIPRSLVSSYEACAARVRSGNWACITTTPHIDSFILASNGTLTKSTDIFQQWYYGFGVRLGSPLRKILSIGILRLGFNGELDMLLEKWLPRDTLCQTPQ